MHTIEMCAHEVSRNEGAEAVDSWVQTIPKTSVNEKSVNTVVGVYENVLKRNSYPCKRES